MNEDYFEKWKKIESRLNQKQFRPFFNRQEIWFCYWGKNIGDEQNGSKDQDYKRPVIVIKKYNKHLFLGVPLTLTIKNSEHYFNFSFKSHQISGAIVSQWRTLDAVRLIEKIGYINKNDFASLIEKLKESFP